MKSKIAFMLFILGLAVAAPYFIKGPDGKPLMSSDSEPELLSTEQTRQTYYKWQDSKGVWHFGDEVPEGVVAQAVGVDTAANVIQSVKVAAREETTEKKRQQEPEANAPGLPMTVPCSPLLPGKVWSTWNWCPTLLPRWPFCMLLPARSSR